MRLTPVDVSGLTSDGLKCWGDDYYGQLGDDSITMPPRRSPSCQLGSSIPTEISIINMQ